MNIQDFEIMNTIRKNGFTNQRILSEQSGYSLGTVNKSLNDLIDAELLDREYRFTNIGKKLFTDGKPKNAVILAAGFGMRMVPVNTETPKGLIEIDGEPLIERLIKQLHEVHITEIYVVVGFLKECYEYLIDQYHVNLVFNPDYASKNNLHSLQKVIDRLGNTYIMPCDVWCRNNPFHKNELYSWYMLGTGTDEDSSVRVNRKKEIVSCDFGSVGNKMIGISYLLESDCGIIKEKVESLCKDRRYDDAFWEESLFDGSKMIVYAREIANDDAVEINTYEQLRELDEKSGQLQSKAIDVIAHTLGVPSERIENIRLMKKGMTNRSFMFSCEGQEYIMRIPGEGTDRLINRTQEESVYRVIKGKGLCDDPVYIDSCTGYKITRFLNDVRACDTESDRDLARCMRLLRDFHQMELRVDHVFDLYKQIEFYETLWNGRDSVYRDYVQTKANVWKIRKFIDGFHSVKCLTHIDAVPDNFLFYHDDMGEEQLQLTDWEYAGMQDPHVDLAMFSIYSMYDRKQIDHLLTLYFEQQPDERIRYKIYAYVAVCGLLWSNWCEYKRDLGVEFGEYNLKQYRFAKEYSRLVLEYIGEEYE